MSAIATNGVVPGKPKIWSSPSPEIKSKLKDTSVPPTDAACFCSELEQPESAYPTVSRIGSLQLYRPTKTFPAHSLLKAVLYNDWPQRALPKCFAQLCYIKGSKRGLSL